MTGNVLSSLKKFTYDSTNRTGIKAYLPFHVESVFLIKFLKQLNSYLFCTRELFEFMERVDQTKVVKKELVRVRHIGQEFLSQKVVSGFEVTIQEVGAYLRQN